MNYLMKYTICGFNQQKLFDYKLDINDAQILRWLIDFAATGRMRKIIENNTIYYLVNYEAIICAFPIMGITSTKAIANRFEKYVKCGLLQKTIRKGGSFSGTATLFAITPLIGDMIYDEKSVETSSKENEKKNFDKNQTSCRNEEKQAPAEPDKNQTSYRDKKQTSCPTRTELPVALKNSSVNSSVINSSSRSFSKTDKNPVLTAEEEQLKKILNYYVDTHGFSEDFIPHLYLKLKEFQIGADKYQEFIDFAYVECNKKVKDKSRLMSYMYNSICDNFFISQFIQNQKIVLDKQKEQESQIIECPVCKTQHSRFEDCPVCGIRNYKNPYEVKFYSKIFSLPEQRKTLLKKELNELSKSVGLEFTPESINKIKTSKEAIYKKYINIPHEEYEKIFG